MLAKLEPNRLNVEEKNRSNLFSWRGQFTPQFVSYLLETYAHPGELILDPFCGSGTVLQEAISHHLSAVGLEINPAAYAMARFFSLSSLNLATRRVLVKGTQETIDSVNSNFKSDLPLFQNSTHYRDSFANLLDFSKQVLSKTDNKQVKLLLLLTLFRSESVKTGNLTQIINRSFRFLADQLFLLPYLEKAPTAILSDARHAHLAINLKANIIITSPPYINVFNYHQNHRALLEIFGFNMLKVAHSEIGANRKHRQNRFLTVIQYCLDIELALNSFSQTLAPDGLLIMVLGRESRVRGVAFGNAEIVSALIEHCGAFSQPQSYERVFINRFGKSIFEDIIICRYLGQFSESRSGYNVAISFLRQAIHQATGEIRANIEEALELAMSVQPSPFFDKLTLI